MRRRLVTAAVVLAAVALAGCATMQVSSHVERGLDFARYRTFDWGPADALPSGDQRLDKDPFFQDWMNATVDDTVGRIPARFPQTQEPLR